MGEVYALVICRLTYKDGSTEIRKILFGEVSATSAEIDDTAIIKYVQERFPEAIKPEIIEKSYFQNRSDYLQYLDSLYDSGKS